MTNPTIREKIAAWLTGHPETQAETLADRDQWAQRALTAERALDDAHDRYDGFCPTCDAPNPWHTAECAVPFRRTIPDEGVPVAYELHQPARYETYVIAKPGDVTAQDREAYDLIPLYRHPARPLDREEIAKAFYNASTRGGSWENAYPVYQDDYRGYADAVIAHLEGGAK